MRHPRRPGDVDHVQPIQPVFAQALLGNLENRGLCLLGRPPAPGPGCGSAHFVGPLAQTSRSTIDIHVDNGTMPIVINIYVDKGPMQNTKLQPLRAWRALRILLNDAEDTQQVFVIVRALTGKSVVRAYNRFATTATGQSVLNEKRVLLDVLTDRDQLRKLAPDSLGRAYLEFVEGENLTADGLVEASESAEGLTENENMARYAMRLRDSHDLWHTVTGYGRDGLGEVCLLGFTYAQTHNPGLALIALAGGLKWVRFVGWRSLTALWHGFRAGRRAAWLPAADWEHLLNLPLDQVREELRVRAPVLYPDLKETALAA